MRPRLQLRLPPNADGRAPYVIAGVLQTVILLVLASILTVPIIKLVRSVREVPQESVQRIRMEPEPLPVRRDSVPGRPPQQPRPAATPSAPTSAAVPVPPVASVPVAPPATIPTTIPPPATTAVLGDTDRRIIGRGLIPQLSPPLTPPGFARAGPPGPPGPLTEMPRNPLPDSAVRTWVRAYWDSLAREQSVVRTERDPTDWTINRGDGKYGVDQQFIYFGKYKLPTMLLALLPLNVQANPSRTERNRVLGEMRADIMYHAMRAQTYAEFNAGVKALRERKEKERIEAEVKKAKAAVYK